MQNRSESGTPCFGTPNSNIDLFRQQNDNKSPPMYKIWDKFVVRFNIFSSPSIICVNKRDVGYKVNLFIKTTKMDKNMG